jgi:hypothetical protein
VRGVPSDPFGRAGYDDDFIFQHGSISFPLPWRF